MSECPSIDDAFSSVGAVLKLFASIVVYFLRCYFINKSRRHLPTTIHALVDIRPREVVLIDIHQVKALQCRDFAVKSLCCAGNVMLLRLRSPDVKYHALFGEVFRLWSRIKTVFHSAIPQCHAAAGKGS